MLQNPPILTPRLTAVARLVPDCQCFFDVGTDHAYLPVYLCLNNVCKTAVASDIKKGPLLRAEKTVEAFGLRDKISLRLGGGLDTASLNEADCVAIAGMGGLVIAKILSQSGGKTTDNCPFILQPMTAVPELREYLSLNGWKIESEGLAKEDEKIYNIMLVRKAKGENEPNKLSEAELYIGKHLIEKRQEHFDEYLEKKIKKLENMIEGLKISKSDEGLDKLNKTKALLAEILKLR